MKYNILLIALCMAACFACRKEVPVELTLGTDRINVPSGGGVFTFDVASNMPTKATVSYDDENSGWILLLPSVLQSDGIIELRVSSYDYVLKDRSATITVTAGDVSKSLKVVQASKPGIFLDQTSLIAVDAARDYSVTVASSGDWTAAVNPEAASWLTFVKGTGTQGESAMTFHLEDIGDNARRDAVITVSVGEESGQLTVSQGYGTVIGNLIWSKCDVGEPNTFTAAPEIRGKLYQYDSKIGYESIFDDTSCPEGFVTTAYAGGATWQDANNPCPPGWRIPTDAETKALIGDNGNKKFYWGWWYDMQGAYVGSAEASSASPTDLKGCIFIPMNGRRIWETGAEDVSSTVFIQTVTRPGNNWQRYIYQVHWDQMMYEIRDENNSAYPVRCVTSVPD